jgi:hypothetical protein
VIIKLALLEEVQAFLRSEAGRRTAIGAAIGGVIGALSRKDNRTHGATVGATLGGLAGLAAHETGLTDNIVSKVKNFKL